MPLTSTAWAPWYIVPANQRQVRNNLVTGLLAAYLEKLNPVAPESEVEHTHLETAPSRQLEEQL